MTLADREVDTAELRTFRQHFPLAFALWDMEEQPLLSTMGGAGQTLLLRLENVGHAPLRADDAHADDAPAAHFTLAFRRGTLRNPQGIRLEAPQEGWRQEAEVSPDGQDDLLHLTAPDDFTLEPGRVVTLLLHRVRSDGARGTRNSRVLLAYRRLRQGEKSLEGHREQVIAVVHQYPPEARGHQGVRRRPLPVRVGFAGSNTVLADVDPKVPGEGSASTLIVQVSNLSTGPLLFRRDPANEDDSSRVILSFDVQDEDEQRAWALGAVSEVNAIEPALGREKSAAGEVLPEWEPVRFADAEQVVWIFTPQQPEIRLAPEQALLLEIANIRTSLPAGPANLHLTLENVPDTQGGFYADQRQTLEAIKSPLRFTNKKVGVGATQPGSRLSVAGGVAVGVTYAQETAGDNNLIVEGRLGVGTAQPGSPLELAGLTNDWDEENKAWVEGNPAKVRFGDDKGRDLHHFSSSRDTVFNSVSGEWHFRQITTYGDLSDFDEVAKITSEGRIEDKRGPVMPVGAILPFAGFNAPRGWKLCDGQWLSKEKYGDLHEVIGDMFRENEQPREGMFRLPNLEGRMPVGFQGNTRFGDMGNLGGAQDVALAMKHMPRHKHGVNDPGHSHTLELHDEGGEDYIDDSGHDRRGHINTSHNKTGIWLDPAGGWDSDTGEIKPEGQSFAHENMPPYQVVRFIIKC